MVDKITVLRRVLRRTERGDFDAILSVPRSVAIEGLRQRVKEAEGMDTKAAFDTLKAAIQEDSDYAWSWHCNIAMASVDEGIDHAAANKAAARFMDLCFGVDTSKSAEYATLHLNAA